MAMYEVNADNISTGDFDVNNDTERVLIISAIVRKYVTNPCVRKKAEEIIQASKCGTNQMCQISSIFNWVKRNIQYLEDPFMIDTYRDPCTTMKARTADCDDYTILLDSLLGSIGFPVGARIISKSIDAPYHHIYSIVIYPKDAEIVIEDDIIRIIGGKPIPLDPTVKGFKPGDELPYAKKRDFIFLFD